MENFLKNSVAAQPGIQMLVLFAILPTDADPTIRVRQPEVVVEGTMFRAMARPDGPVPTEALSLFRQEQANRRARATPLSTVAAAPPAGTASLHAFTSGVPVVAAAAAAATPPSQTASGPQQARASARPEQVRRQALSAAVTDYLRAKGAFMSESSVRTFIMRAGERANLGEMLTIISYGDCIAHRSQSAACAIYLHRGVPGVLTQVVQGDLAQEDLGSAE